MDLTREYREHFEETVSACNTCSKKLLVPFAERPCAECWKKLEEWMKSTVGAPFVIPLMPEEE